MTGDQRSATAVDLRVRQHLAMVLTIVQNGTDNDVAELARMETHRLIAAVLTALRGHGLDQTGRCLSCDNHHCTLRHEISRSLLPVRLPPSGG